MDNKPVSVLGIMSGSSLDGLDLAICSFSKKKGQWSYDLLHGETIPYAAEWKTRLEEASEHTGLNLVKLDIEYGKYIGKQAAMFLSEKHINVEFISSHGHTIFHQPDIGITFQIGSGAEIAAITGITTINDFRSTDLALGGQGAPLVPVGDELLFSNYDYCLNLGGFANISYSDSGQRIAFDICPVNTVLNTLSQKNGQQYDKDGRAGRTGQPNISLLGELNSLPYYHVPAPKSLGKEWVVRDFLPVIEKYPLPICDKIRTVYEHIATQIAKIPDNGKSVLLTGGGTYNKFLIELIRNYSACNYIIPDANIIDFKEAIIFAFLGLLRVNGDINCLASVTGASRDSSGGAVYEGK
jgi:anhydro-N-acetylmuramic acid kinase